MSPLEWIRCRIKRTVSKGCYERYSQSCDALRQRTVHSICAKGLWRVSESAFAASCVKKKRYAPGKRGGGASKVTAAVLQENAILRHTDGSQAALIIEHGELVDMPTRYRIYGADETIYDAFFPTDCVLSVVSEMADGEAIEVGTVGREGTSAIPLLMGGTTTANDCYCQVPGRAIRLPIAHFHHLRTTDTAFRVLLDHFLQAYVSFLGQLTACNRLHNTEERCARWLLLTQDRVGTNRIPLTHEYLAMMIGSRRSGVSLALGALRQAGYIDYMQGAITMPTERVCSERLVNATSLHGSCSRNWDRIVKLTVNYSDLSSTWSHRCRCSASR